MFIYKVAPGDTLQSISRIYGVDAGEVIRINGLTDPDRLAVGQSLILPTETHAYTVRRGETLGQIANRLGEPLALLYADNPTLRDRPLMAGETIFVRSVPAKRGNLEVNGYAYSFIEPELLECTLPYLTYLTIFSYGVTVTGDLVPAEDTALIAAAKAAGVAPVMLLSTIGEDGTFNSASAAAVLENKELGDRLIAELVTVLEEKGYYGIDVDFEFIPENLGEEYADFISRLRAAVEPGIVMVALAPKYSATQRGLLYEAHNYELLGRAADRALIMTYEWGYTYGPPMAIAPLGEVRKVLQYAASVIPPEKILMGMPNYAYDWPLPFERGVTAARSIGNQEAASLAGQENAEILFEDRAASPHFGYTADGQQHEVWLEDARSVLEKLDLVEEFRLKGIGVWNIMRPFEQLWYLLDYYYNIVKLL
ncbi:MAG: glycoside hydrolase family 18 protein [Clostridia bacterium]|nr:glycoside hydrolase family 18 protein [Clostridia bacterium]